MVQELAGGEDVAGREQCGGEMAAVMGNQIACFGLQRKLCESFVIGVRKKRLPEGGGAAGFCAGTEGIEKFVHHGRGQAEAVAFAFQDFFIFGKHGIADDHGKLALRKTDEQRMRCSVFRPQSSQQHVGIKDGTDHVSDFMRGWPWPQGKATEGRRGRLRSRRGEI